MKRLLLVLSLALFGPAAQAQIMQQAVVDIPTAASGCPAAPQISGGSIVQATSATQTISGSGNSSCGNFLLILVSGVIGTPANLVLTPQSGDSWTLLTNQNNGSYGNTIGWYSPSGSFTNTASYSFSIAPGTGNSYLTAQFIALTSATGAFDKQIANSGGCDFCPGATGLEVGASLTPTGVPEIGIAWWGFTFGTSYTTSAWAVNQGFTILGSAGSTTYGSGLVTTYLFQNSGPTAEYPTLTWTNGSTAPDANAGYLWVK